MVYQMSSMIGMVLGNKFQRWQEFRFQDGIAGNVIFISQKLNYTKSKKISK